MPTSTSPSSVEGMDEKSTVFHRKNSRKFSAILVADDGEVCEIKQNQLKSESQIVSSPKDDNDFIEKEIPYAPEGTWGWIIVSGSFLANVVVNGLPLSYGVLTENITSHYSTINTTNANFSEDLSINQPVQSITITQFHIVGSILHSVFYIIAPYASILTENYGHRRTAMLGSFIATIGTLLSWGLSSDEPDFMAFLIGFGFLAGSGFGILYSVSMVIVGQYFDKNVAVATGICVAGTGFGTLIMAPILNEILKVYSWQGAIIFQAVVAAFSTLFGAVYRPLPTKVIKIHRSVSTANSTYSSIPVKEQIKELITSPSYMMFCISGSFIMTGYFAPFGFLKDSASVYVEQDQAVFLLSIVGICSAVGRIGFGLLADKIGNTLRIYNIALTLGGIVTIIYPFATTYFWLILCAIAFGAYAAVVATLRSVITKEIVGPEKFNVGFGISLMFMGFGTLFGNSLGGYLKDSTDNYDMSFYILGCAILLAAFISYPVGWLREYEQRQKGKIASQPPSV